VVRYVDDVADRAHAGEVEPALEPGWGGVNLEAADDRGAVARRQFWIEDLDLTLLGGRSVARGQGPFQRAHAVAGQRLDLAGDPDDRHTVSPVRGDIDV